MQGVLLAAVVVLAVLVLLNLALTLAVIRRLRQQVSDARSADPPVSPPVGTPVPEFTGDATDGTLVASDMLRSGRASIAFLSTGCSACHEQVPELRRYLTAVRSVGEYALVVVGGGDQDGANDLVAGLDGVAPIVVEGEDQTIADAFAVEGFPTYLVVEDGAAAAVHLFVKELRAPVAA